MMDLFFRNWGLKVIAILLAALSFYIIRGAISFEVRYNIPVQVKVDEGVAILEQTPPSVDVTFRGSQDGLGRLDQKYMKAVVRPRLAAAGTPEHLKIGITDITGVSGVRVVDIRPNVVSVIFDRERTKLVPVITPRTIGRPLFGRVELDYAPRFVTIRGPELRLRDITSVSTAPVDVEGRVGSFTNQVRVLSPSTTWVLRVEPPEITVHANINRETSEHTVPDVKVLAITAPGSGVDIRFDPATVAVTLEGREEELANIADSSVQVFVNCVGLDPSATYELPVQIHLPPGTGVHATVEPQSVKATLSTP